jgi:hypothetical protein
MSSSRSPFKRFTFKRSNTAQTTGTGGSSDQSAELTEYPVSKIAAEFGGELHHEPTDAVRGISEVEANSQLNKFRKEHRLDPNLPDVALDAIDDVTGHHDHKGEAVLAEELINDSPYPEVCISSVV